MEQREGFGVDLHTLRLDPKVEVVGLLTTLNGQTAVECEESTAKGLGQRHIGGIIGREVFSKLPETGQEAGDVDLAFCPFEPGEHHLGPLPAQKQLYRG